MLVHIYCIYCYINVVILQGRYFAAFVNMKVASGVNGAVRSAPLIFVCRKWHQWCSDECTIDLRVSQVASMVQ